MTGVRLPPLRRKDNQTPVVSAPMPKPVYPGSLASPSILAHVMSQNYVDGLLLYRQEQQCAPLAYTLSRQTMANWMIYGTELWLAPIVNVMKAYLLQQETLLADEMTLQVLRAPGKSAELTSYLWLYRTGRGLKAVHQAKGQSETLAGQGLAYCNVFFAIERDLKDATPEERYVERQKRSLLVVKAYSAWLRQQRSWTLPKILLGQAITYSLKDERLEINNNRNEPVDQALGRKNWLFANTPLGAKASAAIYSIIETTKENGLHPLQYLKYLFEQLPQLPDPRTPRH